MYALLITVSLALSVSSLTCEDENLLKMMRNVQIFHKQIVDRLNRDVCTKLPYRVLTRVTRDLKYNFTPKVKSVIKYTFLTE